MKKTFLSLLLVLMMLVSSFTSVYAATDAKDKASEKLEDYDNIIINQGKILTCEDFVELRAEMEKGNKPITKEEAKKLIVKTINEKEKMSNSNVTASYTIWGMNLNADELALVVLFPVEAIFVYADAQTALTEAQNLYQAGTLYQGNGDAFRHTYWNALMEYDIGSILAEAFASAHESETPDGIDKTMDLNNNETGRNIGYYYSYSTYKSTVITYVNNGWLNRIVNNQLTVTDSSGRK